MGVDAPAASSPRASTSPMLRRPHMEDAVQALRAAESELAAAQKAEAAAQQRVKDSERRLHHAKQSIEDARVAALSSVRPRRLLTAYALWLFFPLVWPGAYLFYLGRDSHCWLSTVTFGGFGVGWLLDLVYIPTYVADHNELAGYRERAERRLRRW